MGAHEWGGLAEVWCSGGGVQLDLGDGVEWGAGTGLGVDGDGV